MKFPVFSSYKLHLSSLIKVRRYPNHLDFRTRQLHLCLAESESELKASPKRYEDIDMAEAFDTRKPKYAYARFPQYSHIVPTSSTRRSSHTHATSFPRYNNISGTVMSRKESVPRDQARALFETGSIFGLPLLFALASERG